MARDGGHTAKGPSANAKQMAPGRQPMFRGLCGCAKASRSEVGIGLLDLVERIHDERPASDDRLIYGIGVTQNHESGTVCSDLQTISLSQLDEIELGHEAPVHAGL